MMFTERVNLKCSHCAHTHRKRQWDLVKCWIYELAWLWWSFHNVYVYQNIKLYPLNIYSFLFVNSALMKLKKIYLVCWNILKIADFWDTFGYPKDRYFWDKTAHWKFLKKVLLLIKWARSKTRRRRREGGGGRGSGGRGKRKRRTYPRVEKKCDLI